MKKKNLQFKYLHQFKIKGSSVYFPTITRSTRFYLVIVQTSNFNQYGIIKSWEFNNTYRIFFFYNTCLIAPCNNIRYAFSSHVLIAQVSFLILSIYTYYRTNSHGAVGGNRLARGRFLVRCPALTQNLSLCGSKIGPFSLVRKMDRAMTNKWYGDQCQLRMVRIVNKILGYLGNPYSCCTYLKQIKLGFSKH